MKSARIPYFEDEESRLVPDLPVVERDAINAIIRNPANDEYLCLHWGKFNWKTFIIGGIEKGEDPVSAALREIKEETGYHDIKYIIEVGKTRSGYFAKHKNENRISNAVGLLFELASSKQTPPIASEVVHHDFLWIPKKDVASFVNLQSQKYIWNKTLVILDK